MVYYCYCFSSSVCACAVHRYLGLDSVCYGLVLLLLLLEVLFSHLTEDHLFMTGSSMISFAVNGKNQF